MLTFFASTKESLIRFLGISGLYLRNCNYVTAIVTPFTNLRSPKTHFIGTLQCDAAFQQPLKLSSSDLVLQTLDFSRPYTPLVSTIMSVVGAILLQRDSNFSVLYPVADCSARLKLHH